MGFEVAKAKDGTDGLEMLRADEYTFVLCDFLMPVLDGIECVRQYGVWEHKQRSHLSK